MSSAAAVYPLAEDFRWFVRELAPRRVRSMRQFAEEEVRIPEGPFGKLRFNVRRQPFSGLFLDEVDSGRWTEFVAVGPTQSGKTLTVFGIPALYHLFEVEETVACLVPDESMVNDKWQQNFLPIIKASRYAALLPKTGEGSRGGQVRDAVRFENGTTLKFLTGSGDDKSVAGFTSRVLLVTEMNKFGVVVHGSSESDRYRQARGRTRAYGSRARVYAECTVDTEDGLVWTEYLHGTASRIAMPCGYCGAFVTLGREHLVGWDDADSAVAAEAAARWLCPACGVLWTDAERRTFAAGSVLVHRGQEVVDGAVTGDLPPTRTLGFRWSAVDNLLVDGGYIGAGEWHAKYVARNEDLAEREQRQFVWALPVVVEGTKSLELTHMAIARRQGRHGKGVVARGEFLVAMMDLGLRAAHWMVLGVRVDGEEAEEAGGVHYRVVDAGVVEVPSNDMVEGAAIAVGCWEFYDKWCGGWAVDPGEAGAGADPVRVRPLVVLVDSGKWTREVYQFMKEVAALDVSGWFPSKGFGAGQAQAKVYTEPEAVRGRTAYVGDRYHIALQEAAGVFLVHMDADAWKSRVHAALRAPLGGAGTLVLWHDEPRRLHSIGKHLTAEVAVEEFDVARGKWIKRWEARHSNNHWFDCAYGCFVAADYAMRLGLTSARPAAADGAREPGARPVAEAADGDAVGLRRARFGGSLRRE